MQISEGTNSVGIVRLDLGFCLCAVMRSPYFIVLIISKLKTILKINQKYFEKCLQLSKWVVYLYQKLKQKQNGNNSKNNRKQCKS